MSQTDRPEWVEKAAQAVTEWYRQQQEGVEHAKEQAKTQLQASEIKLKTDSQQVEEKIADIIHRHFQGHK